MSFVTSKYYQVRTNECDLRGQATLASLVTYMNEAAWESALSMKVPVELLLENGISWVLHRLKLEIIAFPKHRERVRIDTWPSGKDRFFAYRDYEVRDEAGELMARASSIWLVVDIHKRRMIPLPEWITKLAVEDEKEAMDRPSGKLRIPEECRYQAPIQTLWHHLDVNHHVSNTHYFPWMLEALPYDFLEENQLQSIDLVLKAECLAGQQLLSEAEPQDEHSFLHRLTDTQGKVLVQARSQWY